MASINDYVRAKLDRFKRNVLGPSTPPLDVVSNNASVLNSARARQTLPQTRTLINQAQQAYTQAAPRNVLINQPNRRATDKVLDFGGMGARAIGNYFAPSPQGVRVRDFLREADDFVGGSRNVNRLAAFMAPRVVSQRDLPGTVENLIGGVYSQVNPIKEYFSIASDLPLPSKLTQTALTRLATPAAKRFLGPAAYRAVTRSMTDFGPQVLNKPLGELFGRAQKPLRTVASKTKGRVADITDDAVDALRRLTPRQFQNGRGEIDLDLFGKVETLLKRSNRAGGLNRAERNEALQLLNTVNSRSSQGGAINFGAEIVNPFKKKPKLDPLAQEARKYKSAEEFVSAYKQPIDLDEVSTVVQSIKTNDAGHITNLGNIIKSESAKSVFRDILETPIYVLDKNHPKWKIIADSSGTAKAGMGTINGKNAIFLRGGSSTGDIIPTILEEAQHLLQKQKGRVSRIQQNFSGEGYRQLRGERAIEQSGSNLVDFISKEIKTKSQLTDIYNKAKGMNSQSGFIDFGEIIESIKNLGRRSAKDVPGSLPQPGQPGRGIANPPLNMQGRVVLPSQATKSGRMTLSTERYKQLTEETKQAVSGLVKNATDIKPQDKVGIIDYLRTPDRVLQKIGLGKESDLLRQQYSAYTQELPKEIDRISQWAARVPDPESNTKIFRYLDGHNIQLNPNEFQVAQEIKQYFAQWADRLGLPKDGRIAHYITHIFDKDLISKEFDPDLAKLIREKVAGSVYDPFLEKRLGKMGYIEDTWRALDAYVKRATRKANMDPALEQIKKAAEGMEESQFDYVKQLIDRVNLRPTKIDNLVDNSIKSVVGYKFGGRPTAVITRNVRNMVYRGTLGLNVGSAVRNLTQGVNTYAKLGEKYTVIGYSKLIKNMASRNLDELYEVGVLSDNIIQERKLSAIKSRMEQLDKGLWVFFDAAEKINRGAAYFGAKAKAIAKGATEQEAVKQALKVVRDTQFTFGSIDTPPVLQNDIAKIFTQFQSYPLKQTEFLSELITQKEWAGIARFIGANTLLLYTIGETIGYDRKDLIPFYGILSGETKLGQTPPIQLGKGLIQASLGTPDKYGNEPEGNIAQRIYNNEDVRGALTAFVPGGVQIKKSVQGLKAANQGFSESKSGRARFPVTNPVQAGIMGQYNDQVARFYFDNKLSALSENDTKRLKESIAAGTAPKTAYFELFRGQMARSEKAPEEKERLINGMREVLGINTTQAAAIPVSQPTSATQRKETLGKAKELFKSDLPQNEIQEGLQKLGVTGSSSAGHINELFFWRDEDGDYSSVDLGKYSEVPSSSYLQVKQEKEKFSDLAKIMDSEADETTKQAALQQLGVSSYDGAYYMVANEAADVRSEYVIETLTGTPPEQVLESLAEMRRAVGGKIILTNGVVDDLYDADLITSAEKKYLKSLEHDRKTGQVAPKKSSLKAKKPKQLTIAKVRPAKVPTLKTSRRAPRKFKQIKIAAPKAIKLPQAKISYKNDSVEDFKRKLLARRGV